MANIKIGKGCEMLPIQSHINVDKEAQYINRAITFDENEAGLCAVAGTVRDREKGILICTTKYIYFYDEGHPLGGILKLPISTIEDVSLEKKILSGSTLRLNADGWIYYLHGVPKAPAQEMYYTVRNEILRASKEKSE